MRRKRGASALGAVNRTFRPPAARACNLSLPNADEPGDPGLSTTGNRENVSLNAKDSHPNPEGPGPRAEPMGARVVCGQLSAVLALAVLVADARAADRPMVEAVVGHDSGAVLWSNPTAAAALKPGQEILLKGRNLGPGPITAARRRRPTGDGTSSVQVRLGKLQTESCPRYCSATCANSSATCPPTRPASLDMVEKQQQISNTPTGTISPAKQRRSLCRAALARPREPYRNGPLF